ncbi:MAG: sterol desaturase family protein [Pseudomonadales bacterium]|nr:sterol desaturase family protein [Pseudomonadales bacterium]
MQEMLSFFENMPVLYKLLWLISCISIAWLLENVMPRVHFSYHKAQHARLNFTFLFFTLLINLGFSALLALLLIYLQPLPFGLFSLIHLPVWQELLLALLLFDLIAQYGAHVVLHKVPFLWSFHQIHHSDTAVDTTTGTRHHPVDYIFRELAALTVVLLLAAPLAYYIIYRFCTIFCTYFTHANIALPKKVDRILSVVFVTPDMHKFHHHYQAPWTNRNYGNIFSFWDRLFKTLVYDEGEKIHYGVDSMDSRRDLDLMYLLTAPFKIKDKKPSM